MTGVSDSSYAVSGRSVCGIVETNTTETIKATKKNKNVKGLGLTDASPIKNGSSANRLCQREKCNNLICFGKTLWTAYLTHLTQPLA